MHFIVTSEGNNSTFGDLLFTLPTQEASAAAAEEVAQLCYSSTRAFNAKRLEEELQRMRECEAAYYFLMLKEIADLSRPKSIMMYGQLAGSVIAYLLGISTVDPDDPQIKKEGLDTPVEMIWGPKGKTVLPDFSFGIDPSVRPEIHSRLNARFGKVEVNRDLYCHISMTDHSMDEMAECHQPNWLQMLRRFSDGVEKRLGELKKGEHIDEKYYNDCMNLVEELKGLDICDEATMIRAYAYCCGSFDGKLELKNLSDPNFFVTREELYRALCAYGMPEEVALDFIKKGVWSTGKKRDKYVSLLEYYEAPQPVLDYFSKVHNLWPAASVRSRLPMLCRQGESKKQEE